MGARLKLTPELQDRVCLMLRAGNYCDQVALANGISATTFWRWLKEGEAAAEEGQETPKRDFWDAVTRARAEAEIHAVTTIRAAMPDDWRAAAFYLERGFPKRWGRRSRDEEDDVTAGDRQGFTMAELMKMEEQELAPDG